MAFITADRVLDSSTSTGTGDFVVSGTPAAGYRTFSAVMSVGDTCYYSIQGQTTSEWEVGLGTYSSANTLARTTIYSSSNANAAVSFSAGTKNVFITMVASKSPQLDPSGNVTALGTPASATLTNATGLSLTTGVTGTLSANNGGSLAWQSVQTGNFTAVAGNAYPVNTTSGAVTVTLPASPSAGQVIQIVDYAGTWATNNCTVNPNGKKIANSTASSVLSVSRSSLAFVYIDSTQGWLASYAFKAITLGQPYTASYLAVSGGGGGGGVNGGGGGAGGLLTGSASLTPGVLYSINVGAGGSAGSNSANGGNGGTSSISSGITSPVGGGGGAYNTYPTARSGVAGGSGGGGSNGSTVGLSGPGGAGTSGQGNAGGYGYFPGGLGVGGGGGGAGAVGANATGTQAGAGGAGSASSITGSSVTRAGGGGGGGDSRGAAGGAGGSGGGGAGSGSANGSAGTANTGGGGGGAGAGSGTAGGAGGSGVVILSVPTIYYTGTITGSPTVTTNGSDTILVFNASGSYTA